jgi:hypothetical protein
VKKSIVILICLLVFVLAVALGYSIGLRRGVHRAYLQTTNDYLRDLQFHMELIARTYLDCLQGLDSARPDDMAHLRKHALSALNVYVRGIQDARTQGYTWTPLNDEVFSNAAIYLAQHPTKK